MSKRTLQDWVDDIHSSMRNIESDMRNMSDAEFLEDGKTIRAVAKSITDIGEAAHQLMDEYPEVEAKHPDVWQHLKDVYATRIKITHGYFGLDAGIVWSTVKKSLPVFESLIDKVTVLSEHMPAHSCEAPVHSTEAQVVTESDHELVEQAAQRSAFEEKCKGLPEATPHDLKVGGKVIAQLGDRAVIDMGRGRNVLGPAPATKELDAGKGQGRGG